ncbi:hypothetical protein C0J52_04627 [Blattella germanica]|nr:hypothetical protein C0J52_04627 [Blattella germanica]
MYIFFYSECKTSVSLSVDFEPLRLKAKLGLNTLTTWEGRGVDFEDNTWYCLGPIMGWENIREGALFNKTGITEKRPTLRLSMLCMREFLLSEAGIVDHTDWEENTDLGLHVKYGHTKRSIDGAVEPSPGLEPGLCCPEDPKSKGAGGGNSELKDGDQMLIQNKLVDEDMLRDGLGSAALMELRNRVVRGNCGSRYSLAQLLRLQTQVVLDNYQADPVAEEVICAQEWKFPKIAVNNLKQFTNATFEIVMLTWKNERYVLTEQVMGVLGSII